MDYDPYPMVASEVNDFKKKRKAETDRIIRGSEDFMRYNGWSEEAISRQKEENKREITS